MAIIRNGRRVAHIMRGGRVVKTIIRGGRVVFSAEGLPNGAPMSVSSPVANALGELSINLTEGADAEITADGELTIDSENDYSINQDGQLTVTY